MCGGTQQINLLSGAKSEQNGGKIIRELLCRALPVIQHKFSRHDSPPPPPPPSPLPYPFFPGPSSCLFLPSSHHLLHFPHHLLIIYLVTLTSSPFPICYPTASSPVFPPFPLLSFAHFLVIQTILQSSAICTIFSSSSLLS